MFLPPPTILDPHLRYDNAVHTYHLFILVHLPHGSGIALYDDALGVRLSLQVFPDQLQSQVLQQKTPSVYIKLFKLVYFYVTLKILRLLKM